MKGTIVTMFSSIKDKKIEKRVDISNCMLKKVAITILGCKKVWILTNVVQTPEEYKLLMQEEYDSLKEAIRV